MFGGLCNETKAQLKLFALWTEQFSVKWSSLFVITQLNNLTEGVTKVAIPVVNLDILASIGVVAFVSCVVDILKIVNLKELVFVLKL